MGPQMKDSKNQTAQEYTTTDLYFAAYLQAAGVTMKRTSRAGTGKLDFIFDTSVANIEELKNAWFNQTGRVSAQVYASAIKNLKHICHMP